MRFRDIQNSKHKRHSFMNHLMNLLKTRPNYLNRLLSVLFMFKKPFI